MVLQKVQRSYFIRLCALILASFRPDNGMIEAHAVEFDLDVGSPSEVVVAIRGNVTPAFVATNKSPNKSRVFSKLSS
jgi:hypothetical protein